MSLAYSHVDVFTRNPFGGNSLPVFPDAGHPIIGAAAVLHKHSGAAGAQSWRFQLVAKTVEITTEVTDDGYSGWLNQGAPEFLGTFDDSDATADAFNLEPD